LHQKFRYTSIYCQLSVHLALALFKVPKWYVRRHSIIRLTMRYTLSHALRIPRTSFTTMHHLPALNSRPTTRSIQLTQFTKQPPDCRCFHTSPIQHQNPPASSAHPPSRRSTPNPHTNFYRTHGRALLKALTLAFFTYQVVYWAWLVLETEEIKADKSREIEKLESEVRLLDEERKGAKAAEGNTG
jgi:hypothetical protein